MSLPGIEPGTLSVLDSRDNHYTTESLGQIKLLYSRWGQVKIETVKMFPVMYASMYIFHTVKFCVFNFRDIICHKNVNNLPKFSF